MTQPHHVNNRFELNKIEAGTLLVSIKGNWRTSEGFSAVDEIERELIKDKGINRVRFEVKNLEFWDTSLVAFLVKCENLCQQRKIELDITELPKNLKQLLSLSNKRVTDVELKGPTEKFFLEEIGQNVIDFFEGSRDLMTFVGEMTLSFGKVLSGRGQMRWRDFVVLVQEVGAEALPIVTLISFLVGFIMAFIGFTQLNRFGATIYVADLVGIGIVREMGVMMTGVIMCGRTGAAFAATLGTMKIGEEIDALRTTGISPFDFLVTPRVLALLVMMPILTIYADFIGVFGGLFVTSIFSEVTISEYWQETQVALTMKHISVGMYKSVMFGILIALTGCLRGMQCGSNSSAVGDAATSAVVTGITSLVIADAIFAVLFDALDI